MKLYYAPGACSLAIHCLLEEIGKPYDKQVVNLMSKAQFEPGYLAVNPKAQVPVLERDDRSILTELAAIATWLGDTNPELGLMPTDAESRARMYEAMLFVSTNLHPQGFTRIGRSDKFTPNEADYPVVKARGREIIDDGLKWLNGAIGGNPFLLSKLSVGDFSVFYVEYWAVHRLGIELPPRCAAHFAAMSSRPSIQKAVADEGYPAQKR